ncbi:hypothetical protein QQ045_024958 [Rhodiola kirilowii]
MLYVVQCPYGVISISIAEKLCESRWPQVLKENGWLPLQGFHPPFSLQWRLEEALVRILTPRRSIDILRDVHALKKQRKPYVIVFVGVNGVGNSTNLAKGILVLYCTSVGGYEYLICSSHFTGYEKIPAKEAMQEAQMLFLLTQQAECSRIISLHQR